MVAVKDSEVYKGLIEAIETYMKYRNPDELFVFRMSRSGTEALLKLLKDHIMTFSDMVNVLIQEKEPIKSWLSEIMLNNNDEPIPTSELIKRLESSGFDWCVTWFASMNSFGLEVKPNDCC